MTTVRSASRRIGFLVFPGFQILDLTGPLAAFQTANGVADNEQYTLHTISEHGGPVESSSGLSVITEKALGVAFDTVVIAGGGGFLSIATVPSHCETIRTLSKCARRMTSVCTGAFLLASAGLLDGRRATTHWRYASLLQRQYPGTRIEADHIFVKDGPVWSSAGVTTGIDLALALIEEDLGVEISRAVAKDLVMYHRRPGGQSQFSEMLDLEPSSARIARALAYAREHLADRLSVETLADAASMSTRHFGRAFRAETGETPARAIERLRVEAARVRVENSTEPLEMVGASVGLTDPETMRRAFVRIYGVPPQVIRRASQTRRSGT